MCGRFRNGLGYRSALYAPQVIKLAFQFRPALPRYQIMFRNNQSPLEELILYNSQ
jgi:hypothetical protein